MAMNMSSTSMSQGQMNIRQATSNILLSCSPAICCQLLLLSAICRTFSLLRSSLFVFFLPGTFRWTNRKSWKHTHNRYDVRRNTEPVEPFTSCLSTMLLMGSVVVVVITAAAASVVRFLVASALCLLVPVLGLSHSSLCLALSLSLSLCVSRLSLPLFVFDRFKLLFGFNCMGLPFEFAPSLKSFWQLHFNFIDPTNQRFIRLALFASRSFLFGFPARRSYHLPVGYHE